jgi:rod shape-determining protein MreC
MAWISSERTHGWRSRGLLVRTLIFIICLGLISLSKADISAINSVRSVMTGLVVPVADIVSVPARALSSMVEGMQAVANLREENLRLQEDLRKLSHWQTRAEVLQTENQQLRSITDVIIPDAVRPVTARVVAINADSFVHSVMVNVGANRGLKKGHAVTTSDGLVGMVINVGARHSQVLLLTDINAMFPVILSSSSWPATTVGQNSNKVILRFLPSDANISIGELVQTSGHGGVIPPGLPVGRVASIKETEITVEPLANLQRLSFVTILVTDEDPDFVADDIYDQAFNPLPPEDDGFSLKGLNALGQRLETDILNVGGNN